MRALLWPIDGNGRQIAGGYGAVDAGGACLPHRVDSGKKQTASRRFVGFGDLVPVGAAA